MQDLICQIRKKLRCTRHICIRSNEESEILMARHFHILLF